MGEGYSELLLKTDEEQINVAFQDRPTSALAIPALAFSPIATVSSSAPRPRLT